MPQQQLKPPEKADYEQLAKKYLAEGAYFEAGKVYFKAADECGKSANNDSLRYSFDLDTRAAQSFCKASEKYSKNGDFLKTVVLLYAAEKAAFKSKVSAFIVENPTYNRDAKLGPMLSSATTLNDNISREIGIALLKLAQKNGLKLNDIDMPRVFNYGFSPDYTVDDCLAICARKAIQQAQSSQAYVASMSNKGASNHMLEVILASERNYAAEFPKLAKIIIASVSDSTLKAQLTQQLNQAGF